jgi:hypothetical protein
MSKTDPRKLVCAQCQHENEVERVYCHNCGEKLDRSLLPQIDEVKTAEDQAKTGKKIKKMMNPGGSSFVRNLKTFVLIVIFAAIVAAVFLATQAPENVPPMKSERFPDLEVADVWSGMMNTRPAVSVAFKEFDINYYLRKTVKGGEGPLGTKFVRAFARFSPGLVTASLHRDAWGLPLYNSVTLKPVLADGKWSADVQRFAIGRLTIPSGLAKLVKLDTSTLGMLSKVFEKEIKQLDRVASIEPKENVISFVTKPAQ